MSARKATHVLRSSRQTPPVNQVIPDVSPNAVPAAHRAVVYQALARVDYAVRELDSILRTYAPQDGRVFDLRHAATRLDMVLHIGHSWLVCHPPEQERGQEVRP